MPKRLILFRHAKSSWEENVADHERPLAARGREAAPRMGLWLTREGLVPDLALVSTARRAQQTWQLAQAEVGRPIDRHDTKDIYEAQALQILDAVRGATDGAGTLIVVGHNPGLEDLARLLMAQPDGEPGERLRAKFPTAAIAVLDAEIASWRDLSPRSCRLSHFVTPRYLAEDGASR